MSTYDIITTTTITMTTTMSITMEMKMIIIIEVVALRTTAAVMTTHRRTMDSQRIRPKPKESSEGKLARVKQG
jgi:hypothetical protein